MDDDIRYRPGDPDNNAVLRLALLESWGNRCYWCRMPSDYSVTEIDHIISQETPPDKLAEFLAEHMPPTHREQFDIHAPGNLAPIHGTCNRDKSNLDLAGTGRLTSSLARARSRQPQVAKRVRSFRSSQTVAKAMLAASMADMSDPRSQQALAEFGPLLIHRLSVVAPAMLTHYSVSQEVTDARGTDLDHVVFVMDDAARRTRVLMEDFYRMDFEDVATNVMSAVRDRIVDRLRDAIDSDFDDCGLFYSEVGDPAGRLIIEVDALTFETPNQFTVGGTFDVDMSAEVAVLSGHSDSGTDWLQGDAVAHGRFLVLFWPDDDDPTRVDVDSTQIVDWQAGPALW